MWKRTTRAFEATALRSEPTRGTQPVAYAPARAMPARMVSSPAPGTRSAPAEFAACLRPRCEAFGCELLADGQVARQLLVGEERIGVVGGGEVGVEALAG